MDVIPIVQSNASATNLKVKPAVPKKPLKLMSENEVNRTTHVKDMIRKLQEKENSNSISKPNFTKMGGKTCKIPAVPEKEETNGQTSNQTLEDLKAIDEDIEKLRKQIEERDKIISALREAAEAKDKKLDNLIMEYSKLQSNGKLDLEPNRATSSSPSSPPLCNGELCWTDSFVNKNYHEPVYAQLLNDHAELQKVYNELRTKIESQNENFPKAKAKEQTETPKTEVENKLEAGENAINLIMAEQIKALKEREAQLIWEAEELREQNDLMEFRILELEESRKEFLDKEMNEGKHRTEKIVWRERDIEEISDSGVMSLPTSEDLTSDSELGEAIRNYSPLGAVTNLTLSNSENSHSDPLGGLNDLKQKKSLKSSECLQESGIFVDDCAIPTGTHSKACQTESVLDKTLLDIIDSSCDLFLSKNPGYLEDPKSDDLSTEISKLSVIQKRIQQKTKSPTPKSLNTIVSCPHSNSVLFYEERLAQLEDKLKIYESSGETKDILLAKRLQKEVDLAHRVKELTDKVNSLENLNKKLEEEKCEFEEAENDTRFQCQMLEIKLQELIDKNADLELELERQKVIMNEEKRKGKKKESLESLLTKYEQRNHQMEEKEEETKQRLSMIEAAMPAIVAYNMLKAVHSPDISTLPPTESDSAFKGKQRLSDNSISAHKLEETFGEKKKSKKDFEKSEDQSFKREKVLRAKIEELEAKAAKDRVTIEEMGNNLKKYQLEEKSRRETYGLRPDDVDLFEEVKQMVANEVHLRAEIERLEKKEQAYMQSLEKADEIWAGMEEDYKKRLQEAEEANSELQKRISVLEENQVNLEKTLKERPILEAESLKKTEDFHIKIQELIKENDKLKSDINQSLDKKFEEHRKFLEAENQNLKTELKEMESYSTREEKKFQLLMKELELTKKELERQRELEDKLRRDLEDKTQSVTSIESKLQCQITDLNSELNQKSKELSSLEVTVAELREEVETLENKVGELIGTIQSSVKNQEEVPLSAKVSFSFDESVRHEKLAKVEQVVVAEDRMTEEPPFKFYGKREKPLMPNILQAAAYQFMLFNPLINRQEKMGCAFELKEISKEILVKNEKYTVETYFPRTPETLKVDLFDPREEEIFQLSLKNTELQQILERMEEESEMKDKEFLELQKIALEIRQEQISLEKLYTEKKNRANENPSQQLEEEKVEEENYEIFKPVVNMLEEEIILDTEKSPDIKTTDLKIYDVSQLSSLQIAFDNLQSKYRSKNVMIKSLLDDLKQKGDTNEIDDFVKIALETSSQTQLEEKNFEGHPREINLNEDRKVAKRTIINEVYNVEVSTPKFFNESSSIDGPLFAAFSPLTPTEDDPPDSYIPPIKTIRKVGDDGVFLEWDITHQPDNIIGFEIKVNGHLTHRVRSSTRNKALLRPLNLKEKFFIRVYGITENDRSTRSSYLNYPKKIFF